jgi:hypothetical protein
MSSVSKLMRFIHFPFRGVAGAVPTVHPLHRSLVGVTLQRQTCATTGTLSVPDSNTTTRNSFHPHRCWTRVNLRYLDLLQVV